MARSFLDSRLYELVPTSRQAVAPGDILQYEDARVYV